MTTVYSLVISPYSLITSLSSAPPRNLRENLIKNLKKKIFKNGSIRECILVDVISKESRRKGGFAPPAQGENSSTPLLRRKYLRSRGGKEDLRLRRKEITPLLLYSLENI